MGPCMAVNWHRMTPFVIRVMTIGAMGHGLKRLLGSEVGLAGLIDALATVTSKNGLLE